MLYMYLRERSYILPRLRYGVRGACTNFLEAPAPQHFEWAVGHCCTATKYSDFYPRRALYEYDVTLCLSIYIRSTLCTRRYLQTKGSSFISIILYLRVLNTGTGTRMISVQIQLIRCTEVCWSIEIVGTSSYCCILVQYACKIRK